MLDVTNLQKTFVAPDGERVPVVDVPAFAVAAGEQVALRGESGSGKTTFLNLIAGILAADAGRVAIEGTDMTALPEAQRDRLRAAKLGYIFQTFNLLQGHTVLENVVLGMSFGPHGGDRVHARQVLERVGLGQRLHHFPRQLSTGQQQRATGNLDRAHASVALGLIRDVCREHGAALLLVSHDAEILGAFARVQDFAELNRARARL